MTGTIALMWNGMERFYEEKVARIMHLMHLRATFTSWKRSMPFHIKAMVPVITPTRAKNRFHSFNSSPRPGFASVPSFPDSVDSLSDPPPPPFVTCGCVRHFLPRQRRQLVRSPSASFCDVWLCA